MKIPETPNVGAFYGNEENGQWQPNGVIIDSGVGGGIVGSGDAGIHRPPVYPVHIPRGHIPGYVMAGAFYPPGPYPVPTAAQPDDFEDYMWMENEEEFDKQVMQQLEEEALMEQCIEAMLEDEQRERHRPVANGHNNHLPTTSNGNNLSLEETVSRSTLNPLAAEFVPTRARQPSAPTAPSAPTTEEKHADIKDTPVAAKIVDESPADEISSDKTDSIEVKTEELAITTEPPEVSAADVTSTLIERQDKRREKDIKKEKPKVEVKKAPKQEKEIKIKPQVVKSEPKVQPKKKEPKVVKSEMRLEDKVEEPVDVPKPQQPTIEETSPSPLGIKPINYAAAARANKPKKPNTPPTNEKAAPPPLVKTEKKPERKEKSKIEKPSVKTEKPIQRKNSAK